MNQVRPFQNQQLNQMEEWVGTDEPSETLAKPTVYSNGSEMTRYLPIYMVIIIPEVRTSVIAFVFKNERLNSTWLRLHHDSKRKIAYYLWKV